MVTTLLLTIVLVGAVLASVYFAEIIAHRVGQPYGTLLLAIAVTVIEVALIVSILLSRAPGSEAIVRDSIFATIMIVCNGLIGVCLLIGAIKHRETVFKADGTSITLGLLITASTLAFVLPTYTTSTPGPNYSIVQLRGAAIACLILYLTFVYAQTVRHTVMFMAPNLDGENKTSHLFSKPSKKKTFISAVAMLISLTAVVIIAKKLAPIIGEGVHSIGAPPEVVGILVACLVLLPESFTAIRQALNNKMQNSFNLALGSGLASVGLTIPVVAIISIAFGITLTLGLDAKSLVFLILTFIMSIMTISMGRATFAQGIMHIVIFGAYIRLSISP
jgi:Ca2+:H+ antiporter